MVCGIGLVVEHVLAKDETGVRFSYPAQKLMKHRLDVFYKQERVIRKDNA